MTYTIYKREDAALSASFEVPAKMWAKYPTHVAMNLHKFIEDHPGWIFALDYTVEGGMILLARAPVEPVHHLDNVP